MIRPYTKRDKQRLLDIFKLNIPTYFDASELADLDDYLDKKAETYRVVEIDQTIVGGFGLIIDLARSEASITWIFFDPEHKGNGLGRLAVNYCHNQFRQTHGLQKYTVRTSQFTNVFFEKFGYKTIQIEKDYWGKGLDLYVMNKHV